MKKVSAIIVGYKTADITEEFLSNLKKAYKNLEIIFVDNDSQDGTVEIVKKHKDVRLIESKNNGLSDGYNQGINVATGDYFLFLGTDAFPEKKVIKGMVDYFENNQDVGVATAKLVLEDGSVDMDAHRGFPNPVNSLARLLKFDKFFPKSKAFNSYFMGYEDLNEPHEIDACISHFMMVRRKVLDDIGGFDRGYFLYGEDIDFCYRAKKERWKVMYLPQWEVLHYKGYSVGIRKQTRSSVKRSLKYRIRMQKLTTDAMRLFVKKHYTKKYPKPLLWLMFLGMYLLEKRRIVLEMLSR